MLLASSRYAVDAAKSAESEHGDDQEQDRNAQLQFVADGPAAEHGDLRARAKCGVRYADDKTARDLASRLSYLSMPPRFLVRVATIEKLRSAGSKE
jgi:hypothetical protein